MMGLVLKNGRKVPGGANGAIGIDEDLTVTVGYDSGLEFDATWDSENPLWSDDEKAEMADAVIDRWQRFKAQLGRAPESAIDERMRACIAPDGSLYGDERHIVWRPGQKEVSIDGQFSAAELRWLADYMEQLEAGRAALSKTIRCLLDNMMSTRSSTSGTDE